MCKALRALANVVGQRIRRREDPRFLRGEGRYVDDLQLPGALHVTFVRSYLGHGKINGIDKSAAEATGALVFTAADTDLTVDPVPPFIPIDPRHVPAVPGQRHGQVRGRHRRGRPSRLARGERGRQRAGRDRLRAAAGRDRPGRGGQGRGAPVPRGGDQRLPGGAPGGARPAAARVERRPRQGPRHLAAHLGLSDRTARLGRSVRRGRTDHVVDLVPDAAPGQDVPGHDARPG